MESEINTSLFSADQPLTDPADDKLNRRRLSGEIARSVGNWTGKDSLVISLTGEWGSGKSTIKNFVAYYLKDKAYALEFNPWQWSGQDKLLEAFLWQLGELFGKEDIAKKTKKLASKWKAYASIIKVGGVLSAPLRSVAATFLSLLTIGVALWILSIVFSLPLWLLFGLAVILCLLFSLSFVAKLFATIATALTDWGTFCEKPLEDLRSDIERELKKLDRPVVVFIDDMDRLTDNEIRLLVQLVKANARFPNLVFFLLFHMNIVTSGCGSAASDDCDT